MFSGDHNIRSHINDERLNFTESSLWVDLKSRTNPQTRNSILPCLILPCLAIPCHAMPCLAMPCLAMPYLAMPCHTMPCHTMPCLALSFLAVPCHAMPCHAMPCLALPYLSLPCHAMPCLLPCPALSWPGASYLCSLLRPCAALYFTVFSPVLIFSDTSSQTVAIYSRKNQLKRYKVNKIKYNKARYSKTNRRSECS